MKLRIIFYLERCSCEKGASREGKGLSWAPLSPWHGGHVCMDRAWSGVFRGLGVRVPGWEHCHRGHAMLVRGTGRGDAAGSTEI